MPISVKRYISDDVDNSIFSSLFKYDLDDKGELILLISVGGDDGFLGDKAVKFVGESIRDGYLHSSTGSITEDIKVGLSAGVRKLTELFKNDKRFETTGVELRYSLCLFRGGNVYLGVLGEHELYLFKNSSFVNISNILKQNGAKVASMGLSLDDYILMGTPSTVSLIASNYQGEDVIELFESFADNLEKNSLISILSRKDFPSYENQELEQPVNEEIVVMPEDGELEELQEVPLKTKGVELDKYMKEFASKLSRVFSLVFEFVKKFIKSVYERLLSIVSRIGNTTSLGIGSSLGNKSWYRHLMSKFSSLNLGRGVGVKGMRIDGYKEGLVRGKRILIVIGLVLFLVVFFFGYRLSIDAKAKRDIHKIATQVFTIVNQKLEEAERTIKFDRSQTEIYVSEIKEQFVILEDKELAVDDRNKYVDYINRLNSIEDALFFRKPILESNETISLFIETVTSLDNASNPTDITWRRNMSTTEEYIYISDKGAKAVYRIDLNTKKVYKLPDKNGVLKEPLYVDVGESGIFVFDNKVGVVKSPFDGNGNNKDFVKLVGLEREDIGDNTISELAILNVRDDVFLLDSTDGTVLKSVSTGSGYSLFEQYFKDSNYTDGTDFFADLALYVLSDNVSSFDRYVYNYVKKAYSNAESSIIGVSPEISGLVAGYTQVTSDFHMYVFDQREKRLISLEKPREGGGDILHPNEYHINYQYYYKGDRGDVFNDVKDIIIDHAQESAYILDGSKIWRISL